MWQGRLGLPGKEGFLGQGQWGGGRQQEHMSGRAIPRGHETLAAGSTFPRGLDGGAGLWEDQGPGDVG